MMNEINKFTVERAAPVVIPTLCRYDHFRNCVESLSRCVLADQTDLYIGLDFPAKDSHKEGYNKIKEYIEKGIGGFKSVNVFAHEKNLGAVDNSRFLYNEVKKNHDCYIFTEDDNVFAPNFLLFVNEGLRRYHDDDSVYAVCGYCYPLDKDKENGYFLYPAYSAWGVGEWVKKAEKTQDSNAMLAYVDSILGSVDKVYKLYKKSPATLDGLISMRSRGHYYGDNIMETLLVEERVKCVFPATSKVKNMGHDGSGEHCDNSVDDVYAAQIIDDAKDAHFDLLPADKYQRKEEQMYLFKSRPAAVRIKILVKYILYRLHLLR